MSDEERMDNKKVLADFSPPILATFEEELPQGGTLHKLVVRLDPEDPIVQKLLRNKEAEVEEARKRLNTIAKEPPAKYPLG